VPDNDDSGIELSGSRQNLDPVEPIACAQQVGFGRRVAGGSDIADEVSPVRRVQDRLILDSIDGVTHRTPTNNQVCLANKCEREHHWGRDRRGIVSVPVLNVIA
jgi:hypothetical protein